MNRVLRLLDWNVLNGGCEALISDAGTYTWRDLAGAVEQAAASLADRVVPGTSVGLLLDSTPAFVVYQHAVHLLGGVVVPLNRGLTEDEVIAVLDRLGVSVLVADTAIVLQGVDVRTVDGDLGVVVEQHGPEVAPVVVEPYDLALVLQTSGSTGQPKGVALTHANLAGNYDPTARWIGISREDTILLALPVFNTYALNQGINLMVASGARLRLLRRFDVDAVAAALDKHRPTFVPLVPTMVTRLRQAGVQYDGAITVFVGAAPSPTRLATDVWAVFPQARLLTGYGLTEASAIVTMQEVGRAGVLSEGSATVGRPLPGIDLRIDSSTSGEPGEVLVRGPGVLAGYVGSNEPPPIDDGWLRTGDLGTIDEDGRLSIVGRSRELIIRGGQNVYPTEIEQSLCGHPAVLEASVFGLPDPELGEVPGAAVVLRRGHDADPESIREWLRPQLASFKRPVLVVQVAELPRTATGKVHRSAVAAMVGTARGDS